MATYEDQVQRWLDRVFDQPGRRLPLESMWRMPIMGDRIFSYGSHFELARPLRDRRGAVQGFLLNGDWASQTTSHHQAVVRSALRSQKTVTIPHSALEQAGINIDSVQILDVQEDWWEPYTATSITKPWFWDFDQDYADRHYPNRRMAGDVYTWTDTRHRLGGSVIRAKGEWEVGQTCPHCQGQPLEGPATGWRWEKADGTVEYSEYHRPHCHRCGGAGWIAVTRHRWARFLSGWDEQERRPSYFFCELPRTSKARTVAEAFEDLKPEPVRLAERMHRQVVRQGDIFAVETPTLTRSALKTMGARFEKMGHLLRTNHAATEVAYLANGLTMARGIMHHRPEGRRPDHARRPMGDRQTWHAIIKNTVPLA